MRLPERSRSAHQVLVRPYRYMGERLEGRKYPLRLLVSERRHTWLTRVRSHRLGHRSALPLHSIRATSRGWWRRVCHERLLPWHLARRQCDGLLHFWDTDSPVGSYRSRLTPGRPRRWLAERCSAPHGGHRRSSRHTWHRRRHGRRHPRAQEPPTRLGVSRWTSGRPCPCSGEVCRGRMGTRYRRRSMLRKRRGRVLPGSAKLSLRRVALGQVDRIVRRVARYGSTSQCCRAEMLTVLISRGPLSPQRLGRLAAHLAQYCSAR